MLMHDEIVTNDSAALPVVSRMPAPASTTTPMPSATLTTPAPLSFEPLKLNFQPIQLPAMPTLPTTATSAPAAAEPSAAAPASAPVVAAPVPVPASSPKVEAAPVTADAPAVAAASVAAPAAVAHAASPAEPKAAPEAPVSAETPPATTVAPAYPAAPAVSTTDVAMAEALASVEALVAIVAPSGMPEAVPETATAPVDSPPAPAEASLASLFQDTPEDNFEPLPPPPGESTGLLGLGAKLLKAKTAELAESEKMQKGISFVKDKAAAVAQHDKVQQSVNYVKSKASEVSESERFQKGMEKTKEAVEKTKEKTKEACDMAKEKTKALQEKVGNVWQAGRGSISRARAKVNNMSWKGSARDTLDIAAREEQWKGIKIQGAEEIGVPARTEHTCCYHVSKGSTLRWTFRVKENDIGFGVRMRVQAWGGSKEEEVLPVDRYDSTETISGSWVADEDRRMVLVFDNRYSKLRSKTVAYFTGTERPPVYVDMPTMEPEVAA